MEISTFKLVAVYRQVSILLRRNRAINEMIAQKITSRMKLATIYFVGPFKLVINQRIG